MSKTVKVRAMRPFFGIYGKVGAGDVVEVSQAHAKRYQQKGLAVPANYKMAAAPRNKMEGSPANKADENPSAKSRTGGRTGEGKPLSSSQGGQASTTSTSAKSED